MVRNLKKILKFTLWDQTNKVLKFVQYFPTTYFKSANAFHREGSNTIKKIPITKQRLQRLLHLL